MADKAVETRHHRRRRRSDKRSSRQRKKLMQNVRWLVFGIAAGLPVLLLLIFVVTYAIQWYL